MDISDYEKLEQKFVKEFNRKPSHTINTLLQYVQDEYLTVVYHPTYRNLAVFNYTAKTNNHQFWNLLTLNCRGLVLDLEAEKIIALPFAKFFNYQEEYGSKVIKWACENLDTFCEVFNKIDGSLCIGFFYKGSLLWCTRKSFDNPHTKFVDTFIKSKYGKRELRNICFEYEGMTLVVEVVHKKNKVVVDYPKEDVILLTIFKNANGLELSYNDLLIESERLGLTVVDKYQLKGHNVKESLEELFMETSLWDEYMEGVIVRFTNGCRVKVKGNKYKTLFNERLKK